MGDMYRFTFCIWLMIWPTLLAIFYTFLWYPNPLFTRQTEDHTLNGTLFSITLETRSNGTQDHTLNGTLFSVTLETRSNGTTVEHLEYPWTVQILYAANILRYVGVGLCVITPCIWAMKWQTRRAIVVVIHVFGEIGFLVGCIVFVTDVGRKVGFAYKDLTSTFLLGFYSAILHSILLVVLVFQLYAPSAVKAKANKIMAMLPKPRRRSVSSKGVFVYRRRPRNGQKRETAIYYIPVRSNNGVRTLVHKLWLWDSRNVGIGNDARGLSHNAIYIIDIELIQNQSVLDEYMKQKQSILKRSETCGPLSCYKEGSQPISTTHIIDTVDECRCLGSNIDSDINETYLFHGTTAENAVAIKKEGLDVNRCKRAFCGKGIYFAERPVKADQYTGTGDVHVMILARVLLGNMVLITNPSLISGIQQPPCSYCLKKNCIKHEQKRNGAFDSVVYDKQSGLFREFVVFENCLVYPEFIITYRRVCSTPATVV